MDDNVDPNLSIRTPGNNQTARTNSSDDEVVICSPRGFNQARKKPRGNDTVLEVTDDENDSQRDGSGRPPFDDSRWLRRGRSIFYPSSDEDGRINSEDTEKAKEKGPPSVPVPKEPEFICPVCMEPIVEETTTKCGHIFCKECITKALAVQKKCPTCRRKLRKNDIYRIYFPPT